MRLAALFSMLAASTSLLPTYSATAAGADPASEAKFAWAAFECSVLAGFAGKQKLSDKLFSKGYKNAIQFVSDYRAGAVSNERIQSTVPIGIMLVMGGPTNDFIAGRIYESTQQTVIDALNEPNTIFVNSELRKVKAQNKLHEQNCDLLSR